MKKKHQEKIKKKSVSKKTKKNLHTKKRKSRSYTKNKKKSHRSKNQKKRSVAFKILGAFTAALVLYFVIFFMFFSIGKMDGYAMMPVFNNKDRVIVNRHSDIKRFDFIYMKTPKSNNEKTIRRVIGVPGDKVAYKEDELYINNQKISENFLTSKKKNMGGMILTDDFTLEQVTGEKTVPKNTYFVLGDNRKSSTDSRFYGFVPVKEVVGKVQVRVFPVSKFKVY